MKCRKDKGDKMVNQVMLVGRLVKDVEIKKTESDKDYSSIVLAVNRTFKNNEGVYKTDFIECRLWDKIAKKTFEYCKKGDLIGVRGCIRNIEYINKDGVKVSKDMVVAESITFLATKYSKEITDQEKESIEKTQEKEQQNEMELEQEI